MFIKKEEPVGYWSKIDKNVITNTELSDGAVRLYSYIIGKKDGDFFADSYFTQALKISQKTLANRKRELKRAGLIEILQWKPRVFILFIGSSKHSASKVRRQWEQENAS